jgi:hypothetical protein
MQGIELHRVHRTGYQQQHFLCLRIVFKPARQYAYLTYLALRNYISWAALLCTAKTSDEAAE